MANVNAHKAPGAPFSNSLEIVRLKYDFAEDGGGTGDYDLATMASAVDIVDAYIKVPAAVTSGGAPTVSIGIDGGDEDAIMTAAVGVPANLTLNAVIDGDSAGKKIRVAAAGVIQMTVATAALTAGEIEVVLYLSKA